LLIQPLRCLVAFFTKTTYRTEIKKQSDPISQRIIKEEFKFVCNPLQSIKRKTQKFGVPWSANLKKQHTGIDIAAVAKDKVFAVADGKIVRTGNAGTGWAKYAIIEHGLKNYCTIYTHIIPSVKIDSEIKHGDIIGLIADLGRNTHFHFGVWKSLCNSITPRGALPSIENVGKVGPYYSDPAFPNNFVDPESYLV
jgi:murein DD-endopeptidase MepM/ murein hydrolase activator NlpD